MAKVAFTAPRVAGFKCPADKQQAFLWDATAPGLGLRATPAGKPSYVFQGLCQGKTIRITIGSPAAWTIPNAQAKARELQRQIDEGLDPREVRREAQAAQEQKRAAEAAAAEQARKDAAAAALTVGEVWAVYLEARKEHWGETHYKDHVKLARGGGEVAKRGTRGKGLTIPMPLHPLMALPLGTLDAPTIEAWAACEAKTRPTSARLSWRLLKVFLNWCAEQPEYAGLLPVKNAAATRKTREALGKPKAKKDTLLREQLPAWFAAVRGISNPTIAASLQVMLLTGARLGEVLTMRWADVNVKWRGLTIRDKVEGERVIPLTPYVQALLAGLPRRNEWVFASTRTVDMDPKNVRRRARRAEAGGVEPAAGDVKEASESGHISEPRSHHNCACQTAGIDGLTLHGLRRSFKSLTEWLEIPAGVVAQIMGHKPSATAERHYTVRPLDLLRVHHERIEAWILEQARVTIDAKAEPGKAHLVVA
ncbi:integrase family protein [Xenophilus sp. Marseille-Q4582]|uniref:tyrosine-type recombinase/integrase n=1 Tax=Xenophilus sp. Marseille-Q4582 TaxID=2866600 RepID=UPI001CE43E4C|nr:integrase family protein [Xenophilus sp. Marseille-Q4582]